MITKDDIIAHKALFPSLDDVALIKFLDAKPGRWRYYPSAHKANQARKKYEKFSRYMARENT